MHNMQAGHRGHGQESGHTVQELPCRCEPKHALPSFVSSHTQGCDLRVGTFAKAGNWLCYICPKGTVDHDKNPATPCKSSGGSKPKGKSCKLPANALDAHGHWSKPLFGKTYAVGTFTSLICNKGYAPLPQSANDKLVCDGATGTFLPPAHTKKKGAAQCKRDYSGGGHHFGR